MFESESAKMSCLAAKLLSQAQTSKVKVFEYIFVLSLINLARPNHSKHDCTSLKSCERCHVVKPLLSLSMYASRFASHQCRAFWKRRTGWCLSLVSRPLSLRAIHWDADHWSAEESAPAAPVVSKNGTESAPAAQHDNASCSGLFGRIMKWPIWKNHETKQVVYGRCGLDDENANSWWPIWKNHKHKNHMNKCKNRMNTQQV